VKQKKVVKKKKNSKSPSLGRVKKSVQRFDSNEIRKQLQKLPKKDISPSQRGELQTTYRQLEAEFQQNVARIYNKGAHKSGVMKCHQLIEENCHSPEVVTIFLNAMSNKNLVQVAKSASAGCF